MQDSDRDQRPHEIDDVKEFEDEASKVVDDDAYEIQNSEDWVELNILPSSVQVPAQLDWGSIIITILPTPTPTPGIIPKQILIGWCRKESLPN